MSGVELSAYAPDGVAGTLWVELDPTDRSRAERPGLAVGGRLTTIARALRSQGFTAPAERIVATFYADAAGRLDGGLDLSIALGLLAASGQIDPAPLRRIGAVGALDASGVVGPTRGTLAVARAVAQRRPATLLIAPNVVDEAAIQHGLPLRAVRTLREAVVALVDDGRDDRPEFPARGRERRALRFDDVPGSEAAKGQLMRSVRAGRSVLLLGSRTSGAVRLAQAAASALPPMSFVEGYHVTMLHSTCGLHDGGGLLVDRPVRSPRVDATRQDLLGDSKGVGEVTRALHGVLVLTQIPDRKRSVVESVLSAVRSGRVDTIRGDVHVSYDATGRIVATATPCKCGRAPGPGCTCSVEDHRGYAPRLAFFRRLFDDVIEVAAPSRLDMAR